MQQQQKYHHNSAAMQFDAAWRVEGRAGGIRGKENKEGGGGAEPNARRKTQDKHHSCYTTDAVTTGSAMTPATVL